MTAGGVTENPETDFFRHLVSWVFQDKAKRIGVAVSGGGDSMALLDLLHWNALREDVSLFVATVNHGLRPEAKGEAAMVAAFCADRGLPHDILHWQWDGQGNLQSRARQARYDLLARWAKRNRVKRVALGHTRDDVAETFLMRLARASGVDGLAQMERHLDRHGVAFLRPLLQLSRAELRLYLEGQGITWAEDPSNDDNAFERVRARKVLKVLAPLGIDAKVLGDVAFNIWQAKDALHMYTYFEARDHVQQTSGDLVLPSENASLDRHIPGDILLRLRRAALQFVSGQAYPPRQEAMNDLEMALFAGRKHTLHGCLITKEPGAKRWQDRWRITREYNAVKDLACATDQLWDGRWVLEGPHAADLEIRALGEAGLRAVPDWRDSGMPRMSLLSSPAVWRGDQLISAPLAGFINQWQASLTESRDDFAASLIRR